MSEDAQATYSVPGVRSDPAPTARDVVRDGLPYYSAQARDVVIDFGPEDAQAEDPAPDVSRANRIKFKIKAAKVEVQERLRGEILNVTGAGVALSGLTLGTIYGISCCAKLLYDAIIGTFKCIRPGLQEIGRILAGCLQFELRCFTEDRFLEILEDYESGKIKMRLEEEFLKVGIKTIGLEVKIENIDEVEETKAAIQQSKSPSYEVIYKKSSDVMKAFGMGDTLIIRQKLTKKQKAADEGELSTEKQKAADEGELSTDHEMQKTTDEGELWTEKQKAADEGELSTDHEMQKATDEGELWTEKQKAADEGELSTEMQKAADESELWTEKQKAADESELSTEKQKAADEGEVWTEKQKAADECK